MSEVSVKTKVAVLGAGGYVGEHVCQALELCESYELVKVFRGDNLIEKLQGVEVLIHSANPAKRFRAESNPAQDFLETVEKTHQIIECLAGKKLILISSLSCRTQMDINYGRNRRACELMTLQSKGVVIRLGPMFGGGRTEDTLHSILRGEQVYVASETKYAYVNVSWAASKIVNLINVSSGIYEIGARNSISLAELRDFFKSPSQFEGINDTQIPDSIDGPDARLVIDYALSEVDQIQLSKQ
jgi:nucleoside-diphosphate-sugar epimerase